MDLYDYLFFNNVDHIKQMRGVRLSDIAARRGTYHPKDGYFTEKQPCIKVYPDKDNKKTYYMFTPLYRLVGPKTVLMTEIVEGEWNTDEELNFKWDDFSLDIKDVKRFVLYSYI